MSEQKKKIIFISCLAFIGIALISGIYLANVRYDREVSVISPEEEEKMKKEEEIKSILCEYLGFSEYSSNIGVDFDLMSDSKFITIHYSTYNSEPIVSNYLEEGSEAIKKLIENNLIEWDYKKDELNISIYKIYKARRKDRGEKDVEEIFFMWKTNDLEKGKLIDFNKGYASNKTIEGLKKEETIEEAINNEKKSLEEEKVEKFLKNRR